MWSLINLWNNYRFKIDPTNQECIAEDLSEFTRIFTGSLNFIFLYAIPVMTMLITQILSARMLLRQSLRFAATSHSKPSYHLAARRRVLRMMAIVVATFIITIGPNQFVYFCYNLGVMPEWFYLGTLHRFTVVLASFNSCLNPFIYACQNKRFRQGVREIWTKSDTARAPIFGHTER
ncbi:galanin receptor 2b-like [Lytechinus pictus]|uniref:galanin receptor 2b-like n=1 Tax=Lytechinus pictus TaxID=7653 RepID=UPI0030B9AFB9